ncbi:TLC domain-containing protein [Cokeromyces recurvatus]|uniref:TLC domain-containing protein n=1 Tax=Cokeromyces recurvatus TaxID=90255 RepID=UPI0022210D1F|nr:TLC domain-containing protein [Cokeromyces recurvatus]KAI7901593.1 TLC domain-containing protein [Cokeromyces recurvatus]
MTNRLLLKSDPRRGKLAKFFNRHQIDLPMKFVIPVILGHFLHVEICDRFIFISGQLPNGLYRKSIWDFTFLFFYFCVFTFLRAATMEFVLKPFSVFMKIPKSKKLRFAEQSWLVIYYTISFTSGLILFYNSPTWNDTSYFWRHYPVWELERHLKYYYLLQFAFWIQQPFVLQIEAPRKDYVEYMIHHINTLLLVGLSYACNFTRVGLAVFVSMDLPDVLLCLAKTLHYLQYGFICDLTFILMVFSWMYTRVYYYGCIIWSTFTEPELYVPEFKLDPLNGNWFPHFTKYIILGLMLGLYTLIIFWTLMIFKVVIKLFTTTGITDVRSDDEITEIEEDSNSPSATTTLNGYLAPPDAIKGKKRRLSRTEQIKNYAARR